LQFVISEIARILKEGIPPRINKNNIVLDRPNFSSKSVKVLLPLIAIYDSFFKFEEVGFGAGFSETREQIVEEFSGDGKTTLFKFRELPLRPLVKVESPKNYFRKEGDDFNVDYTKGTLTFRSPPAKGKNNALITYNIAKSAAQIKGLRLEIECNVDVWAKNAADCDMIAIDAMKALLVSTEELESKGINLRPSKGFSIVDDDGGRDSHGQDENTRMNKMENVSRSRTEGRESRLAKEAYGKRLIYIAETNVKADIKIPRIEKIYIKGEK
jgi:hypothetical protein